MPQAAHSSRLYNETALIYAVHMATSLVTVPVRGFERFIVSHLTSTAVMSKYRELQQAVRAVETSNEAGAPAASRAEAQRKRDEVSVVSASGRASGANAD